MGTLLIGFFKIVIKFAVLYVDNDFSLSYKFVKCNFTEVFKLFISVSGFSSLFWTLKENQFLLSVVSSITFWLHLSLKKFRSLK